MYTPKNQLDIGVNAGDLVGVVQQKDPMGNRHRWFVDNGITQGFLPSHVLNSIGENDIQAQREAESLTKKQQSQSPIKPNHAYDDVAKEIDDPPGPPPPLSIQKDAPPSPMEDGFQPSRKAPPVPKQFQKTGDYHDDNEKEGQQARGNDNIIDNHETKTGDQEKCECTSPKDPPPSEVTTNSHGGAEPETTIEPTSKKTTNHYSYDELTASEVASQVIPKFFSLNKFELKFIPFYLLCLPAIPRSEPNL